MYSFNARVYHSSFLNAAGFHVEWEKEERGKEKNKRKAKEQWNRLTADWQLLFGQRLGWWLVRMATRVKTRPMISTFISTNDIVETSAQPSTLKRCFLWKSHSKRQQLGGRKRQQHLLPKKRGHEMRRRGKTGTWLWFVDGVGSSCCLSPLLEAFSGCDWLKDGRREPCPLFCSRCLWPVENCTSHCTSHRTRASLCNRSCVTEEAGDFNVWRC